MGETAMRRRTTKQDGRRITAAFERLETRQVLAAPAASGPATASVIQGSPLAFSGSSLVSVTDADATDTESVAVLADRLRGAQRVLLVGNGGIALELAGHCAANAGMPEVVWAVRHASIGDAFFDRHEKGS